MASRIFREECNLICRRYSKEDAAFAAAGLINAFRHVDLQNTLCMSRQYRDNRRVTVPGDILNLTHEPVGQIDRLDLPAIVDPDDSS